MVRYRVIAFVACVALASNAPAPTVGSLPPSGSSYISKNPSAAALLLVDPTHPVTEAGSLTTATLRWESAPAAGCASAYKLKFFRPSTSGGLTFVAERGPFNLPASAGLVTTALTPPVDVVAGDLLGVVQLQNSCGGVALGNADDDRVFYSADADPTSGTFTGSRLSRGFAIHARASSDPSVLEGYIPVVGATAGGFGSQFKTGLQISNIDADPISGKLVFHPAGASGAASDPAVTYSLSAYQTVSYDNIMETLGRTGLGSIDILSTSSSAPLITTRVFTDAGALGTSGFTEETQPPQAALGAAERASFTIPSDLTNFRVNIGARSLGSGATITVSTLLATGVFGTGPFTRTYPPNFFEQVSLAQFINNTPIPAGGQVAIIVSSGNVILYGATNDNRTNDPSIKFFTKE